jgi:hypothetical protein
MPGSAAAATTIPVAGLTLPSPTPCAAPAAATAAAAAAAGGCLSTCRHYNNIVMVDWRDRRLGANRTINFALNSSDVGPDLTTQSLPPFTNPCNDLYDR